MNPPLMDPIWTHFLWACVVLCVTALLCSQWNVPEVKLLREELEFLRSTYDSDVIQHGIRLDNIDEWQRQTGEFIQTHGKHIRDLRGLTDRLEKALIEQRDGTATSVKSAHDRIDELRTNHDGLKRLIDEAKQRIGNIELAEGVTPTPPRRGGRF